MTDMSNVEFIRDLAARMFRSATPAIGFDQGDTDRLYVIANRLAALEQAGEPVDAGGVTEDDVIGLINIVTDLAEVDALDKAYPEVWGRLDAMVNHAVAAATAAKDAAIRARDDHFRNAQRLADKLVAKDAEIAEMAEAVRCIMARCEALEDEASNGTATTTANGRDETHEAGFWRGQKSTAKSIREHLHDMTRAAFSEAREAGAKD